MILEVIGIVIYYFGLAVEMAQKHIASDTFYVCVTILIAALVIAKGK